MSKDSSLRNMVNPPESVKAFGREYQIRKFNVGQIALALEFIGPIGLLLQALEGLPKNPDGTPRSANDVIFPLIQSLAFSGDSIIGLISVATTEPIEWVKEQDDEMGAVRLLAATIRRNLPLFSPENVREAKALGGELLSAIQTLGGELSTNSSTTDTVTTQS